jgi:predicted dehydrogenase
MGLMGSRHVEVLRLHPYLSFSAVVSSNQQKQMEASQQGARVFESVKEMITSGLVDLIVIATPHWQHAELAIAALRAGLHVVCEKPLAVTAAQADAVLSVAGSSKGLLTVVFQSRLQPAFQHAKSILATGELGPILHCEMTETFWRSEAYYRSSKWRGTWKGEGGGVLLNQAPHLLDRYVWLCGMPESVVGVCNTVLHNIEVEDTASALFRHKHGAQGFVHVSTNECPSAARISITCDRGRITIENGRFRAERLRESIRSYTATASEFWGEMEHETQEIDFDSADFGVELLGRFYTNVALAVAGREQPLVTAAEASRSVELANAILLSSAASRAIDLPLNREQYDAFIASKIEASPETMVLNS